jgi:hypothetical protein
MSDKYFGLIHSIALDEPNSNYDAARIQEVALTAKDMAVIVEQEPGVIADSVNRHDTLLDREITQALATDDTMELGRIFRREIAAQCKARILPDVQDECRRLSELRATQRSAERRRANEASIPAEGPL